ncbi:hypothetical protein T484DRAFT_1751696 [Baffinella frigidus]|nr:hypothetical protein T484DRAFT_1751696 [Cryptophyta sp. CCMP2293]
MPIASSADRSTQTPDHEKCVGTCFGMSLLTGILKSAKARLSQRTEKLEDHMGCRPPCWESAMTGSRGRDEGERGPQPRGLSSSRARNMSFSKASSAPANSKLQRARVGLYRRRATSATQVASDACADACFTLSREELARLREIRANAVDNRDNYSSMPRMFPPPPECVEQMVSTVLLPEGCSRCPSIYGDGRL